MANNPYVNKVQYGGNTLIDLTSDTVSADKVASGYTFHSASGAQLTGTSNAITPNEQTFSQVNDIVTSYLANVDYTDVAYTSSEISTYSTVSTSYDKSQPTGQSITVPAGTMTVNDDFGTRKKTVSAGSQTIYNIAPTANGGKVVVDSSGVKSISTIKPTGSLRMIRLDNVKNVRDLGGWTCDGGTVKYGMLFRGRELSGEAYPTLSDDDKLVLRDLLEIGAELDLRSSGETDYDNDDPTDDITTSVIGAEYLQVGITPYTGIQLDNAEQNALYVKALNWLFDKAIYGIPTYIHCVYGADRTGTIAYICSALLGVSRSDIDKDYEMSSFMQLGLQRPRTYAGYVTMQNYLDTMTGSTIRDKVLDWAIKSGITLEKINAFRTAMIDGSPSALTYTLPSYTVDTSGLSNITADVSTVTAYQGYEATLTPSTGKTIDTATVSMGGTDISASALIIQSYPSSLGKVSIPRVTGNIVLTGTVAARLPSAYQEVEWIQSSGTEYIDTGIASSIEIEAVFDVECTTTPSAVNCLFGSTDSSNHRFYVSYGSGNYYTVAGDSYKSDGMNTYSESGVTYDPMSIGRATWKAHWLSGYSRLEIAPHGSSSFKYGGLNIASAATGNASSLTLFGRNNNGTVSNYGKYKFYSGQIEQNGTLVRDLVPCYRISDSVIGLYDLVNDVFYDNDGTGTFTKGGDV